jgi:hypothetical protein
MAYTSNVPVSGQSLGSSRPIINANFAAIAALIAENHQPFNATNAGYHTFVDLLNQGSTAQNPPTGTVCHYSNLIGGVTEWMFQREEAAGPTPGAIIQMSSGNANQGAGSPTSPYGQSFLPGGFQIKWGYEANVAGLGSNPYTVTYADGTHGLNNFPTSTIAVFMTSAVGSAAFYVRTQSATNFTFSSTSGGVSNQVAWLAIGY